jgi:type VI secretion system protein VasD
MTMNRDARRYLVRCLIVVCGLISLMGCAPMAAIGAAASVASSAMEMVGLKDPGIAPEKVQLTLQAGKDLNLSQGESMSVVVRIYYLKDAERFLHAPMAQLMDPTQESAMLGDDLMAARELTLTPGQRYTHTELVPREAKVIGIVALFHTPAVGGWKRVFDTARAKNDGIVVGIQADAIRVVRGRTVSTHWEQK